MANFNVHIHYAKHATRGLARILNAFIEACNERSRLPKYVIVIPDKDVTTNLKSYNVATSVVMGAALHYLIRQFDILTDRHQIDLLDKKPGAIMDDLDGNEYMPHFVWVCMLKRLPSLVDAMHNILGLCGKFNSVLEEQLLSGKNN